MIRKKKCPHLKNKQKKEKLQEKAAREKANLDDNVRKRNAIEERLNSTKALDKLKERESELKRQNEEDQAIIQDDNTLPSEREAAEARVVERNEALTHLQTQIEERERALPLSGQVKEVFQKIWCDGDSHISHHRRHYRGCRGGSHKHSESHRQSYGKRSKRHWLESWLNSSLSDWLDR